jgi:uncharacterized membrane protein YccC
MIKSDDPRQAVRLVTACAMAYGGSRLIGLEEGYWALISAVVVTQPALGSTLAAGRDRVIGTIIGALAGLAVLWGAQLGISSFLLFWVALLPLAILTAVKPNLRLCCITLAIVVLVPSAGTPFIRPLQRILEILIGTVASIIVTAAVPRRE